VREFLAVMKKIYLIAGNFCLTSFTAMNILDRKVFAPGTGKANSGNDFSKRSLGFNNSLSPQPGRSLWLAAEYKF